MYNKYCNKEYVTEDLVNNVIYIILINFDLIQPAS